MLPALKESQPNYQRYSIVTKWSEINGEQLAQYGIEQITLDGTGKTVTTTVHEISDDRGMVLELLRRIELEDVPTTAFEEIVEDFVTEMALFD